MRPAKQAKWPVKELLLGICLGGGVYLTLQGYNVLPALAMAAVLLVVSQSPAMRSGMGRPRTVAGPGTGTTIPTVQFTEIGGQGAAKKELQEALDFIVQRDRIKRMGIRPLKGILLTGPPGTGKTLLAKAAASYTNSVFMAASGSEFVEMYAGVGAARVRELFKHAREQARQSSRRSAIIFLDEVEVLGGRRGFHSSHMEYDQTLNQLLIEMDGIQVDEEVQVLVIGATNRPDLLDPALLRPGRFDRLVQVDLPDLTGRAGILQIHAKGKPMAADVDLEQVAKETFSFSGAQLEALLNEAAILALREGSAEVQQRHLTEAVDKVILGEKVDRRPRADEKRRVAIHEAGHALVGEWVEPGSVATVTVTPRGRAMGYVRSHPGEDRYLYTRAMLEGQVRVALAGAVAEELCFGSRSTGARADFEQVVDLAQKIILSGLSELGVVDPDTLDRGRENEMKQHIIATQEEVVRTFLSERVAVLEAVAAILTEREVISGAELRTLAAAHATAAAAAAPDAPAEEAAAEPEAVGVTG